VRRAIAGGSLAWEAGLVAAGHRLTQTRRDAGADAWHLAHADFHLALLAGCGNRFLLAAAGSLRERAELYRRWTEPVAMEDAPEEDDEHQRLVRAAVARDADEAERLLREHIAVTRTLRLRIPA
jgi:DNA-binding GntR family transcriptional regulator